MKVKIWCSIILQQYNKKEKFAEIKPWYLIKAKKIQFSESGRILIVATKNTSNLLVYSILPESTSYKIQLSYSLFWGYTPAKLSSISISSNDWFITLSTMNGTTHVFYIPQKFKSNELKNLFQNSQITKVDMKNVIKVNWAYKINHKDHLRLNEQQPISYVALLPKRFDS